MTPQMLRAGKDFVPSQGFGCDCMQRCGGVRASAIGAPEPKRSAGVTLAARLALLLRLAVLFEGGTVAIMGFVMGTAREL